MVRTFMSAEVYKREIDICINVFTLNRHPLSNNHNWTYLYVHNTGICIVYLM